MKKRILLAEDDAGVRTSLTGVLLAEGYEVISANNGQQALELAASTEVNLVLLDINMPVKGGWDTFQQLTGDDPFLPIIIITARPNQLFTALAAGVGALLEKPLDIPALLKTMKNLLAESPERRLARLMGKHEPFFYHPTVARDSTSLPRHWGINE